MWSLVVVPGNEERDRKRAFAVAGELVAAAAAFSLLALWLSGRPLRRQGSRRGHLHGRVGRATGAALALIALTGGVLAFAKPLRERFYPPPTASAGKVATPDPVRIISAGSRAYSGTQLERVLFPVRPGQPAALRFADGARVWVDVDGEVLRTESVLSPWLNLLYPLHSGRVLGKLGPPLMALFGVVLLFLTCSGYLLRSKRHRPR